MEDLFAQLGIEPAPSRTLLLGALVMARLAPAVGLAPFLGGKLVPRTVKTGVALALALIVYPLVAASAPPRLPSATLPVVALLLKEVLVGFLIGFVAGLVYHAVENAGRIVDVMRGSNLASALVPQLGARASLLGDLQFQLAIVLFLVLGGHRLYIAALVYSYSVAPVGSFGWTGEGLVATASLAINLTGGVIATALGLAFPVIAALVLADLVLGLASRFAPQVNAFFLGMPAKALGGLLVVFLALGLLVGEFKENLAQSLREVREMIDTTS